MAAFTHLNPEGSRFTDGSFGVFYAGHTLDTAIAETRHHRTRFLTATDEPAQEIDMRVYAIDLEASLHDIRGLADSHAHLYDPDSYIHAQGLGAELRDAGSDGIRYQSVRHPGGECAAASCPIAGRNGISAICGTARPSRPSMKRRASIRKRAR